MKNNIMSAVKSKKFIIIASSIIAFVLLIAAVRFFGLQYYMYYLIYDFDDVIETLLKISAFAVIVMFAFVLFKKLDLHDKKSEENKTEKRDVSELKEKVNHRRNIIIILSVISVLILTALFIFSSRYFAIYYLLDNLDDIIENVFKLAAIIFVFLFGKKLLEKL